MKLGAPLIFLLLSANQLAHAEDWMLSADGTLYGYRSEMQLRNDSVLNPNNLVAQLAERSNLAEGRFNLKAKSAALSFYARPVLLAQQDNIGTESTNKSSSYISQWQAHWQTSEHSSINGGRELLNWGPAQFRSPSNPFYFNNGRSNPIAELSGMDALRLLWSPSINTSVYAAQLFGSGQNHATPDPWNTGWLLKADWRGEESTLGMALAQAAQHAVFFGAHAQQMLGDEWLLYAELGSSTLNNALVSPADSNQPFTVNSESARKTDYLLGAAYTLENGQTWRAEYLHDERGYTQAELSAYFARAANAANNLPSAMPILALASSAPPLLGRDYLHLVWQSNLLVISGFWRAMFTHNLTDSSSELSAYTEQALSTRWSIFASASLTDGGAQRELSRFYTQFISAGIKLALP